MNCKDVQKFLFFSFFFIITFYGSDAKPRRFHECAGLHYRQSHRVITNDTKPFLVFGYDEQAENGPSKWPGSCNSGKNQSPIAYDHVPSTPGSAQNPLKMIGAFNTQPQKVHVINSGHGATWSFVYADNAVPQITGGPLNNEIYNFVQFHFHYPCEHLPKKYKMSCQLEIHFVHFNSKYGNLSTAVLNPDGLAVIGVLYEEGSKRGSQYFPYLSMIKNVYDPDTDYTETKNVFSYAEAVGFTIIPKIVSYKGSLTTPACSEAVTWIVVDKLFTISTSDLGKFYKIRDHEGKRIKQNNRPVQPINGRPIFTFNEL